MSETIKFLAVMIAAFVIVCLGVGLVISAFIGGRLTRAGKVRAVIGGVLLAVSLAAYFVFFK